jgi:hypothetical protein
MRSIKPTAALRPKADIRQRNCNVRLCAIFLTFDVDGTASDHVPGIVFCLEGKRHEQKLNSRSSLFGGADLCCRGKKRGSCSGTFAA